MDGSPTDDDEASSVVAVGNGVPDDDIYDGGCGPAARMGKEEWSAEMART